MLISILLLLSLCSHFPFELGSILADNQLTGFATTHNAVGNLYTFNLNSATVDGLGRLISADETLTRPSGSTVSHSLSYTYDRRSQLTDASMTNIIGLGTWSGDYNYRNDGNLDDRSVTGEGMLGFAYDYNDDQSDDGNVMTQIGNDDLTWDQNGQLTGRAATTSFNYNWDNKLRQTDWGNDYLLLKYDPDGNRIYRESKVGPTTTKRKYIVDVAGGLPVILLELDPDNNDSVKKTYIHAHDQIIAQHDGDYDANRYFYLHDRLGSVRQIIDVNASVKHLYTYGPFGKKLEDDPDPAILQNPFQFAGQYYDEEIGQLHLRERQYDPHLQRFTAFDPINGNFNEPLTLHQYLYCLNNPLNRTDLTGEAPTNVTETNATTTIGSGMVTAGGGTAVTQLQNIQEFVRVVSTRSWVYGQTVYNAAAGKISYSALVQGFLLVLI